MATGGDEGHRRDGEISVSHEPLLGDSCSGGETPLPRQTPQNADLIAAPRSAASLKDIEILLFDGA